jgi:hypothetical protein
MVSLIIELYSAEHSFWQGVFLFSLLKTDGNIAHKNSAGGTARNRVVHLTPEKHLSRKDYQIVEHQHVEIVREPHIHEHQHLEENHAHSHWPDTHHRHEH